MSQSKNGWWHLAFLLGILPFSLNIFNGIQSFASEGVAFKVSLLLTVLIFGAWATLFVIDAMRYESQKTYKKQKNIDGPLLVLLLVHLAFTCVTYARGFFDGVNSLQATVSQVISAGVCLGIPLAFSIFRTQEILPDILMARAFLVSIICFSVINIIMGVLGFQSTSFVEIGEGGPQNRMLQLVGVGC
jgi:hypothetical protein